jgi:hypothetical protein
MLTVTDASLVLSISPSSALLHGGPVCAAFFRGRTVLTRHCSRDDGKGAADGRIYLGRDLEAVQQTYVSNHHLRVI